MGGWKETVQRLFFDDRFEWFYEEDAFRNCLPLIDKVFQDSGIDYIEALRLKKQVVHVFRGKLFRVSRDEAGRRVYMEVYRTISRVLLSHFYDKRSVLFKRVIDDSRKTVAYSLQDCVTMIAADVIKNGRITAEIHDLIDSITNLESKEDFIKDLDRAVENYGAILSQAEKEILLVVKEKIEEKGGNSESVDGAILERELGLLV